VDCTRIRRRFRPDREVHDRRVPAGSGVPRKNSSAVIAFPPAR
jgi:hypothetical protein